MSTTVGNQNIIWGITDDAALGFFESLEYEEDGELTEVPNGDGAIIAAIFSGNKINVKGTFVIDSSQTMPTRGGVLSVSQGIVAGPTVGDIYLVKTTQTFSNSDVAKFAFEGTNWPDIAVVP
jgi:hypothetical protein